MADDAKMTLEESEAMLKGQEKKIVQWDEGRPIT